MDSAVNSGLITLLDSNTQSKLASTYRVIGYFEMSFQEIRALPNGNKLLQAWDNIHNIEESLMGVIPKTIETLQKLETAETK